MKIVRLSYKSRGADTSYGPTPTRVAKRRGRNPEWEKDDRRYLTGSEDNNRGSNVFRHAFSQQRLLPRCPSRGKCAKCREFLRLEARRPAMDLQCRGPNCFCVVLKKREREKEGEGGREKSTIYIGQFRSRRAARTKLSEKYRRVNNTLIS